MATYVLLHGAYQGGWIWQRVAPHLRAAGHAVFAPTLDGCAERHHALRRGIDTESQAVEISEISRAAYQAGGLDLVRLLDAERARVDAELSYVRALESYHLSVVDLNYTEGMDQ